FEIHRRILRELADVGDDELERPALFWDGAKPVRFRMHRFEAHLVQHAIQVDKTLVAIGCGPTEAHRLIRVLYRDLADVEVLGSPDGPRGPLTCWRRRQAGWRCRGCAAAARAPRSTRRASRRSSR